MSAVSNPTAVGSRSWRAPEPRPAVAGASLPGSGSWLAAQGRLPLAFLALGLAWLAAATALLAAQPGLLALPHAEPKVVALTHAWVLGVFVTVACGAAYQLAPVALGTTLWSERHGWWHLALHAIGVPGMVYCFWQWDLEGVGIFGALVTVGVALFSYNLWRTVRRSGRRDAVAWSLELAAAWLLLTVLAGLTLAANGRWGFIHADPLALLRAHAHLGLIGFFVTLLQGVTFRLVPMFTLGEVRDWRPVNWGLILTQLGLVGLVPALAFQSAAATMTSGGVILIGFGASGFGLVRALGTRKKRALDPGLWTFLRGMVGLGLAAVLGFALAWPTSAGRGQPEAMTYGLLIVAGGLLPCIAGMLCKIVPFLTWMRAYGPKVGRIATPAAASLTHARLERWAFGLQLAALAPLLAGSWLGNGFLLRVGIWTLAIGIYAFLADMVGVLRHLHWPVEAPLAASKEGAK